MKFINFKEIKETVNYFYYIEIQQDLRYNSLFTTI